MLVHNHDIHKILYETHTPNHKYYLFFLFAVQRMLKTKMLLEAMIH